MTDSCSQLPYDRICTDTLKGVTLGWKRLSTATRSQCCLCQTSKSFMSYSSRCKIRKLINPLFCLCATSRRPFLQSGRLVAPFRTIGLPEKMTVIPSADDPPLSTSNSLALMHPTEAERRATWLLNGQNWRGALSLPAYLRREEFLGNQSLTRSGGLSSWVLVDNSSPPPAPRRILATCETIRKKALVAKPGRRVEEVISHSIGSVFCDPKLRGRGFARRMMRELAQRLDTWQQEAETTTDFTVLFSDIGKVGERRNPRKLSLVHASNLHFRNSMQNVDGTLALQVTLNCHHCRVKIATPFTATFLWRKHCMQMIWLSCVIWMKPF